MVPDPADTWEDVLGSGLEIYCCLCGAFESGPEELYDLLNTDHPRWCRAVAAKLHSLGWELEPGERLFCPDCAKRKPAVPPLPRLVLPCVHWKFGGPPIPDPVEFSGRVRQHQLEITGGHNYNWRPAECAIPRPKVRVVYMAPEGGERVDRFVDLVSANGEWFTAAELLFQLHNAITDSLRGADHCFFEGLSLFPETEGREVPVYGLTQGS